MNKKHFFILLFAGILSACTKSNTIQFNVTATGLSDGTFVVKDLGQKTIFGDNIVNGKCTVKSILEEPGFYMLDVVKNGDTKAHIPFEVYLEPATYTITVDAKNLNKYPQIETDSKKQQEINNYNALFKRLGNGLDERVASLNKELESNRDLTMEERKALIIKISDTEDKEHHMHYVALEQYVNKYPQSELAAHFMIKQNYEEQPLKYSKLLARLNPTAINSDEGKEISKTLDRAIKLLPGHKAPGIEGKSFDGKPFSKIIAGKKIFLIDFWRSVNQFSRENNEKITPIYTEFSNKGFEVIGVSLDNKQLWWATALKDDKMPWPQISDLKGNDSPNAANWGITTIPTYYLVDADWKIIKRDISLSQVRLEVSQYLEKHP